MDCLMDFIFASIRANVAALIFALYICSFLYDVSQGLQAQESSQSRKINELRDQIQVLAKEIDKLKLEKDIVPSQNASEDSWKDYGFGPASSKIYQKFSGVSIGGYGEVLYNNFASQDESGRDVARDKNYDILDLLRAVFYFGYKFNDRIILNTEIEIEHAKELSAEFVQLDFLITNSINFRAGLLLAPLGIVNEIHEPPTYLGANRSLTERFLIPTTWREIGFGFFGKWKGIHYKLYAFGSLNGVNFSSSGVRGGRQKGAKSLAEDFGMAVRLDYKIGGFLVGVSTFFGDSGQNANNAELDLLTSISDFHIDWKWKGIYFRSVLSLVALDEDGVRGINEINSLEGDDSIGTSMIGGYLEFGYDLLYFLKKNTHVLMPYIRTEWLDTQLSVPGGYSRDAANSRSIYTFGLSYLPIPNIAFKADYQLMLNAADTGISQWNVSMSYYF